MSNGGRGPGVRRFWEARNRGADVDVKAIARDHPDEALDLADAIWEAARQDDSVARERMWLARTEVLSRSGEQVTLGSLIRSSREDASLSTTDLVSRVRERGVAVNPTAVEGIETDRIKITNVKTPGLWRTLAEVLQIDRHKLVATIRYALSDPKTTQRFTRMERGASRATRNTFLSSELAQKQNDESTRYINWVRTELDLPPTPPDAVQ